MNTPEPERRDSPFGIPLPSDGALRRAIVRLLRGPAQKMLGLNRLTSIYDSCPPNMTPVEFAQYSLKQLNVEYLVSEEDRLSIPTDGPVVVLANHPFGGIEGVIMAALMGSVRSDIRIMANYLLGRIDELKPWLIEVDPFGRASSPKRNIRPLKMAMNWVKDGGMLAVFPSGEVAHRNWRRWTITDPVWAPSIGRLIRRTGASVLPVYFDGTNSRLFNLIGLINKRLRTAMLPHEILNKSNRKLPVRIGSLIEQKKLRDIQDNRALMEYLRVRTFLLADRVEATPEQDPVGEPSPVTAEKSLTVVTPQSRENLTREVEHLPKDALLLTSGKYEVYCARAVHMPSLLVEIGRLREVTFRQVGEGTGDDIDLDRFDNYYLHLFIWHAENQDIVGAYRLGPTDLIVPRYGVKGLYTRTLYRYRKAMVDSIWPAIELGRSFVRPKYQREFAPLHLLWKGIGQYLIRNRQYRYLFGPVSISARYHSTSMRLMVEYLKRHNFSTELARLVKPTHPPKVKRSRAYDKKLTSSMLTDLEALTSLVAEIETGKGGIPILLKHYLRLGGRVLGFNVDSRFSDVIDALILIDLLKTDRRIMSKYFGREEAAAFLESHAHPLESAPTRPRPRGVRRLLRKKSS